MIDNSRPTGLKKRQLGIKKKEKNTFDLSHSTVSSIEPLQHPREPFLVKWTDSVLTKAISSHSLAAQMAPPSAIVVGTYNVLQDHTILKEMT